MKDSEKDKKRKRGALYATIGYHIALFLILFLVSWKEPFPLPEPKSIEIEFMGGSGSEGGSPSAANSSDSPTSSTPQEEVKTQSESPVEVPPGNAKVTTTNTSNPTSTTATTQTTTTTSSNPFTGNNPFGGGNGEKGNSVGSNVGEGDKGTGGGNTGGNGTGEGTHKGPGVSMKGRKQVASPIPENPNFERGKVAFTIYVNRDGIVTKAIFDPANSSTNDAVLISSCKKELIGKQIVNADPAAPEEQKGNYLFEFNVR